MFGNGAADLEEAQTAAAPRRVVQVQQRSTVRTQDSRHCGLYLNPPDKAIVLSVDEKSQIQALDRAQPILPLRPGLPERQTHDYERHGTTTLFAALNVLEGTVIGECQPRHRHQEFLGFLDRIDQSLDAGLEIHLVLDNYGTHKHPEVKKWLAA
jgi:transposase